MNADWVPACVETSIHDVGRSIALWISAFEITAHPGGKDGNVDLIEVSELLEKTPWVTTESGSAT